ncbi:MAG TPA: PBP1A family penicillin-binding protein [Longimicrobium sp.]|nr:PBP1A family penicillin-binding protein [Longimicrobium sp.]
MRHTGRRSWKRRLAIALAVLLVLGLSGFAWLWFAPCGFGGCAPVGELEKFQAEGSQLYDMRGQPIGSLAMVNRRVVSLDSLPEYLPRAVLAVEDRRFYEHHGVDWKRFLGALWRNVRARGVEEGGSTITMQLARNLFPKHLPYRDRSIRRKVLEVRVARQIERAFDKRKILELYLNHIYLGEGAYGVEAASRVYFGKAAADLTLPEAALIAGLAQSPSRLNPRENREGSRRRRDLVLREMAKAGYITAQQAAEAVRTPVRVQRRAARTGQRHAWFIERVRRELEERIGTEFYTAGLRVHTTLDPAAQRAAEEELARQADAIEAGAFGAFRHPTYPEAKGKTTEDGSTPYLQGMAVVMEVGDGAIRALVSGRDYDDSKFDRAFQGLRQPGSAFKPFVYLAALDQGLPASHQVEDSPVRLVMAGGETWEPRNYTGRYEGPMTLREALTRSKNTVTVKLAQEVGMPAVVRAARQMGITSQVPANPAVALGAAEVTPIELVRAYAAFSSGGWLPEPHVIERVEDRDGTVLYQAQPARERVVDPAVAYVLTTMLRDVVDRGTGTPARAAGFTGPAAGKTGTTNRATDVWFVGYTPDLVGAVWYGLDRPETIVRGASGGTIAAPVWGRMMARIYARRRAPADWVMPRGVVTERVDRSTGLAVDETCPPRGEIYTEYFVHVRPARQVCYADYPVFAYDTTWTDEEMGAYQYPDYETYDPDTVGMGSGDLRSRGIVFPELEERRRRGDTQTRPLQGDVDGDGTSSSGTRTPITPPSPSTEPRRDPPPRVSEDRGPRVLGRPVEPAEPPTPPDTTGTE